MEVVTVDVGLEVGLEVGLVVGVVVGIARRMLAKVGTRTRPLGRCR